MGVTFRSIIIGAALIPFNAMWIALSEIMWYSGEPTTISLFYNVIFILCVLLGCNALVRRFRKEWELDGRELLVIYTMLCVASAMASHDMLQILIPTMSNLHRFEPMERRFGTIMAYVPNWLVVADQTALKGAYEGQDTIFAEKNYLPWLEPLGWWSLFVFALCAVLWGMNLVFRKQWTENEKLSYPVLQVPMMLSTNVGELMRSRAFWAAFSIAAFIDIMNGLHALFPLFPGIPIVHIMNIQTLFTERPMIDMGGAWVSFYPFAIGMCFFMPLDLAFSCWFFFLFWKAQRVLASHIGINGMVGFPFVDEQTAGGYYALAFIAIWISRYQIKQIVMILLGRALPGTTTWEKQEAWIAAFLIVTGNLFLFWFCYTAGMSAWMLIAFFTMYYLISIAITRMRAELGPPCHDLHAIGPDRQLVKFFGASNMNTPINGARYPSTLVMFTFMNFFNRAYRGHPMPHGMEGFRIAERLKMDNMRYLLAMAISVVLGTVCAFFAVLWVFNKYGASAQVLGPGEYFGAEAWNITFANFTAPPIHQNSNLIAVIIGIFSGLFLAAMRMAFIWWPLHPVGYAISGSWSMEQLWLCIMLAWLIKMLLLKYGGAKAYKPAVPFFVGLILGDFLIGSFWNIYGIIMETKVYHFWPY